MMEKRRLKVFRSILFIRLLYMKEQMTFLCHLFFFLHYHQEE